MLALADTLNQLGAYHALYYGQYLRLCDASFLSEFSPGTVVAGGLITAGIFSSCRSRSESSSLLRRASSFSHQLGNCQCHHPFQGPEQL